MQVSVGSIAQSFYVSSKVGFFITSLDLFFYRPAVPKTPISLQLRLMDNGIPSSSVISKCINMPDTIVHAVDGISPTRFTFPHPIFLEGSKDYCFVVSSDDADVKIWAATMGKRTVVAGDTTTATGEYISKQPYSGSMFRSQNDETWTPEQLSDIKFTINRAHFNATSGVTQLLSGMPSSAVTSPYTSKLIDPFSFVAGSTVVKVLHPNHGMSNGSTVVFNGSGNFGGVPSTELFGVSKTITKLTTDVYTITTTTPATTTIKTGLNVVATNYVSFAELVLKMNTITPATTSINCDIAAADFSGAYSTYTNILPDSSVSYNTLRTSKSSNDGGVLLNATMTSNSGGFVSPVIDLDGAGVVAVANRVSPKLLNGLPNTSVAKYVQQAITLKNPADSFVTHLDVNRPVGTDVVVQYRVGQDSVKGLDWIDATEASPKPFASDSSTFTEYKFTQSVDVDFYVIQIRILFWSDNEAVVPRVKNLRTITLKS